VILPQRADTHAAVPDTTGHREFVQEPLSDDDLYIEFHRPEANIPCVHLQLLPPAKVDITSHLRQPGEPGVDRAALPASATARYVSAEHAPPFRRRARRDMVAETLREAS
jgi:hypothetical protein